MLNREALLDLTHFTMQLADTMKVRWLVAPFEADHQCA